LPEALAKPHAIWWKGVEHRPSGCCTWEAPLTLKAMAKDGSGHFSRWFRRRAMGQLPLRSRAPVLG
jgi:hypothetical protein